jgi:iron complex transport system substrate-binding protein
MKNAIRSLLLLGFSLAALSGCNSDRPSSLQAVPETDDRRCVEDFQRDRDYFPDKVTIDEAKGFEIEYYNHYKVITVRNPWQDADRSFQYVLVQCGTPLPEGYDDTQMVTVPVTSVVTLSTTHLPYLEKLNALDRLVGVFNIRHISSPKVLDRIESGQTMEVGSDSVLDLEKILNLNPDLVTVFGMGDPSHDSHPQLIEAGVPVAVYAEHLENSPLGRAEWLKFTAAFLNREAEATMKFAAIARDYQQLVERVRTVDDRPTVFTGASHNGTWYVPGGDSYGAQLLEDAGADYLWQHRPGRLSLPLSFEAVYDRAADADFWLNVRSDWTQKSHVIADDPRYGNFAAWHGDRIYNNNARVNPHGGNDYWESGIVNPHIILADLVQIFHPQLLPETDPVYYQKLD